MQHAGSTTGEPQPVETGEGRVFPCEACGADLTFHVGNQSLTCPYCGHVKQLEVSQQEVAEQDFGAMLELLRRRRSDGNTGAVPTQQVGCDGCGGSITFSGTLTSSECPYCARPIQREKIHDSDQRVPVDGVLPFQIQKQQASSALRDWVSSRWFAPGDFKKKGAQGKFNGVYMPYWTYDTMTSVHFSGEQGEHYYETVGTGENQRRERKTRWYPASGSFDRFFDDVTVCAGSGLAADVTTSLEPWPIDKCVPFNQQVIAGFMARTYDLPLDQGFEHAKRRIDAAIERAVRQEIGGDEQRVHNISSRYQAITYKHLLLPCWLLSYRYGAKVFQVVVNAASGEVSGERPYSVGKIVGLIVFIILAVVTVGWLAGG